jgi:hypothetical protein
VDDDEDEDETIISSSTVANRRGDDVRAAAAAALFVVGLTQADAESKEDVRRRSVAAENRMIESERAMSLENKVQ